MARRRIQCKCHFLFISVGIRGGGRRATLQTTSQRANRFLSSQNRFFWQTMNWIWNRVVCIENGINYPASNAALLWEEMVLLLENLRVCFCLNWFVFFVGRSRNPFKSKATCEIRNEPQERFPALLFFYQKLQSENLKNGNRALLFLLA